MVSDSCAKLYEIITVDHIENGACLNYKYNSFKFSLICLKLLSLIRRIK